LNPFLCRAALVAAREKVRAALACRTGA